eukprot:Hpha_TRINITY_DN35720_c0_g1::TRINITY_DN35720_c0_g1_i1::g.139871::m.139871
MEIQVWARLEDGAEGSEMPIGLPANCAVAQLLQKCVETFEFPRGPVRAGALRLLDGMGEPINNRVQVEHLDGGSTYLIRVVTDGPGSGGGAPPAPAGGGGGSYTGAMVTPPPRMPAAGGYGGKGHLDSHELEVSQFARYNGLDSDTVFTLQRCKPETVRAVIAGGHPVDAQCRNPSAVVMSRVRKLEPDVGLLVAKGHKGGGPPPHPGYGGWDKGGWDKGGKGKGYGG